MNNELPEIVQAAQEKTLFYAAEYYSYLKMSIIPLRGKRPALKSWKVYHERRSTQREISQWSKDHVLDNIGIVCGAVSNNLVVLDIDGEAGYPAFTKRFPHLKNTYTVATGSGVGHHVYFRVKRLPDSIKAMNTPLGNLEICANGRQVVAPPSLHPKTGKLYKVHVVADILHVDNLDDLVAWVESFKQSNRHTQQPVQTHYTGDATINPQVISTISQTLLSRGFVQHDEWLHGRCIYPERHRNGDRNASFGFNTQTGYGNCYVCGTILAKDICDRLNINAHNLGGLVEKTQQTHTPEPPKNIDLNREPEPEAEDEDVQLPQWLSQYVDWAGRTGNQTPLIFHQAAGLWLLSIAVGRRLYGAAPWGVKLYPNLYLMLIAGTTFYRKSTAYKLAEGVARESIPHMLMPTPGSPERFQEALAGRMPHNFDKLSKDQQERLTAAKPFAAQRGLLKDEVAGLFGTINKKDYMTGMKDLLMELYDCPDYFDKDTQSGLNIVQNAALSILGVTTPAGLGAAISQADWANGLLIRFALLTPESNYQERPSAGKYLPAPQQLIEDLRTLHEKLPSPEEDALKLNVQCWDLVQKYGDHLRQMCNPRSDTELDDRLKGVYGRLHVQAFKLATLFAALDWLKTKDATPTVTAEHWNAGKAIAETWRQSAHRLLEQLDRSGEAVKEKRHQDRMLASIRERREAGCALRDLYRKLHLTAKIGRQIAQELVKAGLVIEVRSNGAEAYVATEFTYKH